MKIRRSARLVEMTHYLMQNPRKLISLTFFSERFKSAKSSISEDLGIIKQAFEQSGIGTLLSVAGAAGGIKYIPFMQQKEADELVSHLTQLFQEQGRLLPGGYLYMTDVLGNTNLMNQVGKLFASLFADQEVDYVMTVETKGIPLAYAVANYLDVPVVIVRRDNKVTEGSTVSINFVSGSSKRIQTMTLSKRSLPEHSRVLIIDDFMKAGGTVKGMRSLIEEFSSEIVGIGVLIESENRDETLVEQYYSLLKLAEVDEKQKKITIDRGNYASKLEEVKSYLIHQEE